LTSSGPVSPSTPQARHKGVKEEYLKRENLHSNLSFQKHIF
jgi:hypothetical protein